RFAAVHAIEEAAFYAIPAARLFGIASVADLDSDLARQLQDDRSALARVLARPAVWLRRLALRRADAVVAVAQQMSEIAKAESPGTLLFEIRDVPVEGATREPDPQVVAALRAELGLEGRRLIVYTGNVDRRQGLETLLHAMPAIVERHPDARLLVVGGSDAGIETLRATADMLQIGDVVHLIGRRPVATMPEYMGLAEVLVSPRLEPHATPLKIFTYMASGRPIVATDLPTHTQVLDGDTAILVPPTPEGLAEGLNAALDDPEAAAASGARARQRAAARHTYGHFKRQFAEAYAQVLSKPDVAGDHAVEDAGSIVHG
ncbi:MAG: glycosyltransferase, partial [Geminicoccaceae bacterium]|nr:glycosyltransferase [Geminicoccaceae bacterium]